MKKFTIIDYIIIILVICAVIFAFIHITTDDSSDLQKTAFDESTVNKIPDTYLKYYKDGFIVNATVDGFNSTNGEQVTLSGNVIWMDDEGNANVKLLIQSNNSNYTAGLYRYNPQSDIYIDHISLETNGEKYKNLTELTLKPKDISSLNDLISKIDGDANFEISTVVSLDSINAQKMQEIANVLAESGRPSIKVSGQDMDNQLIITKATSQNIKDADSILGNVHGVTDKITIRVYNSTEKQIDSIKDNFEVINIRNF